MRSRILAVAALALFSSAASYAGGPAFVAGSGYDPGVEGQPLLWTNASVEYFTDQGALSPILTNAQANAFVATAIAPWTSAPGVGLTVTPGGELAEDVNGSNIQVTGGVITAPADVTPQATGTPLSIVYDYDGSVTDALLGQGAGSLDDCFTNAVYGGPDNFAASGNIVHALAVINGICASTNAQLPDVEYRLVRVLGRIFGLAWSQANVNVLTGDPAPTAADYQGFPVMHFADPVNCVPISFCYPDAAVPKMDDVTALARLYPAPGGNPQPAGRIYGNVNFTDSSGNAAQPMQGVNVVARLIDGTGEPSRLYVVASVSGFEFAGNAGNIITGYLNANGLPFNSFGSSDTTVEGFFDLGQLTIPTGQSTAEYQLSVEALDPNWSTGVEPYGPDQVAPSGSFTPVLVNIQSGANVEQNILMLGSAIAQMHPGSGSTYANPAPLPKGGGWGSWISGYGSTDWFEFTAQANRTASVAVTALDEAGNPTESKLLPIIGIWELSDQSGDPAPASTPSAFNSTTFGMSRLDAQFTVSEAFRVGVADYRGDGRPDYSYQASVLYSDTATPARVSLAGGVTTLQGIGFIPGLQVSAGGNNGSLLSQSATQMQVALPAAAQDGAATIQVTDPVSGSFSQMLGALTYGAAATDLLLLLQGGEPLTPVGSQAANIIRVRATASDGVTPVNGATLAWSATNGVQFSACGGATSCSVFTDEAGEASTWVTPTATGQSTITAALAPESYAPAQTQQATLFGTSTALDLAALPPTRWIAQGATLNVPLTVEALDLGVPKANIAVNYTVTQGTAALSSGSATTNSSGLATVTAQLTNLSANVQVSACVAPGNSPCQTFTLFAVAPTSWILETVSGTAQVVPNGQSFQPLVMRVTDGSAADNPVMGANVTFVTTLERNPQGPGGPPQGDSYQGGNGMPIILGTSQTQAVTDQNGLASIIPTVGSLGPCDAYITVTAGSAMAQFELESVDPITVAQQQSKQGAVPRAPRRAAHFDSEQTTPPDAGVTLFAVPEAMPFAEPSPNACSDTSRSVASNASSGSTATGAPGTGTAGTGDPATQPCASSDLPDVESAPPPLEPHAETPKESARPPEPAQSPPSPAPAAAGNSAPTSSLLDDKRSCRFAQAEEGTSP